MDHIGVFVLQTHMNDISRATIERVVAAANSAPSGDNCQPWTFRWDGIALTVHHDAERARHVLNHKNLLSYLTLGCMLEALSIGARAEGLCVEEQLHLEEGDRAAPWATVRFVEGAAGDHNGLAMLHARVTDRRLYPRGAVRPDILRALGREAERYPTCSVHFDARLPAELIDFAVQADGYPWRHPAAYRDIMRWMRFSEREFAEARDGVKWQSLGLDLPDIPGLWLARHELSSRVVERLGLYHLSGFWARAQLRSSSMLVCFTARAPGKQNLLQAGRLAMAAWLCLNQAGYAVQPFTLPSSLVYLHATQNLPEGTLPEFVALFDRGREILRRSFEYPVTELPVWLLRAGPAPKEPLPPALRTLRLPLDQILTFE